ncbi:MAG: hypothetical protein AB1925_09855 [Actinomycetota bacterium]
MGIEHHIGRVGALAVALGIGSAVVGLAGAAQAETDEATGSADTSQRVDAPAAGGGKVADRPWRARVHKGTAESDAAGGTSASKQRSGTKRTATAADDRNPKPLRKIRGDVDDTVDVSSIPKVPKNQALADNDAPISPTSTVTPAGGEPAVATEHSIASVPKVATVLRTLFTPKPTPEPAENPRDSAAPTLLWTIVASARREVGEPSIRSHSGATSSSMVPPVVAQAAAGVSELPGRTFQPPVVTADGSVYQVTSEPKGSREATTHVFVLDDNAQVVTSADIDGYPNFGAARPDGTLIIVTSNQRGSRSTVSSVDSLGTVKTVARIKGAPNSTIRVGADGALYISTEVPTFGVMGATRNYRLVRISPNNTAQALPYDTAVELRPDGSAYLVSTQGGFSTLRVYSATGGKRTIALPYDSNPSAPIVDADGAVYVIAGVEGLFSGKTTRLYTVTETSNTVRTLNGLPGRTVITPDGLYLETFTYPGSSDDGTGTTLISKITATTVDTSDVITGRIVNFAMQVAADGTVFAPLRVPSSTTTPVVIVAPDGTVTTVTVPGPITPVWIDQGGQITMPPATDDVGYVNYTAGGTEHVAVLNTDGTIARTIDLPVGATGTTVFFGPDGSPYQLLRYPGADVSATGWQVLALYVTTGMKGLFGGKTTRVYTVTETSSTVRTVTGLPGRTVVTPDGVYLETYSYPGSSDDGTGTTFISKITASTVDTSDVIDGRIASFLMQVAADGTVFAPLAAPSSSTTTPVVVVAPDGTVTMVTVPGTPAQVSAPPGRENTVSPGTGSVGYINYTAGGTEHVAVLNTDGTIARTIDLPTGATGNSVVFFGPDDAPYQLLHYSGADGYATGWQVLALATDTLTAEVPGSVGYVQFGPDGTGYLSGQGSGGAQSLLGFDSAGNTVIPLSEFNSLTVVYTDLLERQVLTFAPDGTAYVINNDFPALTASVYALTPSGAQKVLEVDRTAGRAFLSAFEANGTGYVTVQTTTRDTVVYSFSALTVL